MPVLKLSEIEFKIAVQNNINSNATLTSHSNSLQTNIYIQTYKFWQRAIMSLLVFFQGKSMAVCELRVNLINNKGRKIMIRISLLKEFRQVYFNSCTCIKSPKIFFSNKTVTSIRFLVKRAVKAFSSNHFRSFVVLLFFSSFIT